jgi:fumarate hydratase subunit alpha
VRTREIKARDITETVKGLCVTANTVLRSDVLAALTGCHREAAEDTLAKNMLGVLLENAEIAAAERIPICQDTGIPVVFVEMGKDVIVREGSLPEAVQAGVAEAYTENHFRASVVSDPLLRDNTGTNTPAVLHIDIVDGDSVRISVMPKGFGCENKGRIVMLNPTCGADEIVDFCVETVKLADADACPPYVLGIGLGGTMDSCALMAKKALLRPVGEPNPKEHLAEIERRVMDRANGLDIGVMGLHGTATVMGASVVDGPTHIAGLPVAVNISCHALRSASGVV